MKKMTADEARKHALAHGAELVIGGRPFNSSRQQIVSDQRKAAFADVAPISQDPTISALDAPVKPPVPKDGAISQADLDRLLQAQEQRFQSLMQQTLTMMQPAGDVDDDMLPSVFFPVFDKDGAITSVRVEYTRLQ